MLKLKGLELGLIGLVFESLFVMECLGLELGLGCWLGCWLLLEWVLEFEMLLLQ